jgi:beta-glucosidase
VSQAKQSGVDVRRYYHWSFTDNWEWAEGELPKFGLVALNYETQERTIRDSGRFFSDIIKNGGITPDAYEKFVSQQQYRIG